MKLLLRKSWREAVRQLRTVERRNILEKLCRETPELTGMPTFEVEFAPEGNSSKFDLPQQISHWECETRLLLKDGKPKAYWLAALARFEEYREKSVNVTAIFNLDGSMRSLYKTPSICSENGAYRPSVPSALEWRETPADNPVLALLVDSILQSASPPQKGAAR
jgi:hypothetical protein